MNIQVWAPEAFQRKTAGILGYYNGDRCNDYADKNGTPRALPQENCTWYENDQLIQKHMKSCELILPII